MSVMVTLVISYRLLTPKIIFEYQKLILFADVLQPKKSLIEPGSLPTQSRAARASNPQLHIRKCACSVVLKSVMEIKDLQYLSVIYKLKNTM